MIYDGKINHFTTWGLMCLLIPRVKSEHTSLLTRDRKHCLCKKNNELLPSPRLNVIHPTAELANNFIVWTESY